MARRGENIFKRQDGRWEGRYIKERDAQNKAKYGYVYAKTYREVKKKLLNAKIAVCNKEESNRKLVDFCWEWLEKTRNQVKASTYAKYYNIAKNHIVPAFGAVKFCDITTEAVEKYVSGKMKNGYYSEKTIKDIISVMKNIFAYAEKSGAENSCKFGEINFRAPKKNISILQKDEYNIFLNYLITDTDNTKLGILIGLCTGVRIGELCALRFDDISDGFVFVSKTMQRIQTMSDQKKKTEIRITAPKSDCSIRSIPLPPFLTDLLHMFYRKGAYILTGKADKYVEPRTLQNRFKKHLEACGLKSRNFHVCRHTYASYCIEAGVEVKCLSEILGHSTVNITLNRYVHSTMDFKRESVKKFNEEIIFKPSKL